VETRTIGGAILRVVRGDITEQQVDAVVNAANSTLLGGGGVDGAIHRRGGPTILEQCRAIRRTRYPDGLPTGDAVATTAGDLPARWVIHTVGPVWQGGGHGEDALLASCYRSAMDLAARHGVGSIAFPSISTGVYGFPVERAARIAIETLRAMALQHPQIRTIRMVTFGDETCRAYEDAIGEFLD
jgi:O-acetyl-ADP-ribose deacetylase